MFKIGEFSRLGQVSTRMLRHYDKLGLLTPNETDQFTSYRYYTINQLSQLHRIIALRDLGFSLAEIGELLRDGDVSAEQMRGMLNLKKAEVQRDLAIGQMRLQNIESRLIQIESEGQPSEYEIVVKSVAAYTAATVRETVPHANEMGYYCENMLSRVYNALQQQGVRRLQPEGLLYHLDEYREENLDVEAAVAIHPKHLARGQIDDVVQVREIEAHDLVASLIYEGPMHGMRNAVLTLVGWVGRNNHVPAGAMREVHLSGSVHADDVVEDELVTELMVPIAKASTM